MLQMIHSLHLHRLKTDHADNKVVCNLSVLGKTDLLQICCRSAGFVRDGPGVWMLYSTSDVWMLYSTSGVWMLYHGPGVWMLYFRSGVWMLYSTSDVWMLYH